MLIYTNLEPSQTIKTFSHTDPKIDNTMVKATLLFGVFLCLVIGATSTHVPENMTSTTTPAVTTPQPSSNVNPFYTRWILDLFFAALTFGLLLICFFIWGMYTCCQKVGDHTSTLVQNTYPTRVPWHMRFSDSDTTIQPLLHRMIIDIQ